MPQTRLCQTNLPNLNLQSLSRPPNLKLHHALWSRCVAMIAQAKSALRLPLQRVVAMANLAASSAISRALAVMASPHAKAAVRVSHRVVRVWAMPLSVRNAMRWSLLKMPCAVWLLRLTAKC